MLRIRPLVGRRRGTKVWVIRMTAKRLVSNVWRASERGTSRAGRVQLRPLFEL